MADSLSLASDYMATMQIRYPYITLRTDNFRYGCDEMLVSLSLQILLENAVKHTASNGEEPVTVHIRRDCDRVVVSNNVPTSASTCRNKIPSTGIGLDNLNKRTFLLCGKTISIKRDDRLFEVSIPIIKKEKA